MLQIPAGQVIDAAQALKLAGRWALAGQLLAAASADTPAERAAVSMARATIAADADFWHQRASEGAETAAEEVISFITDGAGEAAELTLLRYDLELLRLQRDYSAELFRSDGRDPVALDELAARARHLRETAPDRGRSGSAAFWAGVIEDNLRGDPVAARALFTEALAAGEETGDDLLTAYALRHLGWANDQAGHPGLAREQWRRAAELRQRAGCVPLTLAQQLLIAEMTVKDDPGTALPVAAEVRQWAAALGITMLETGAAALLEAAGR
jgi:tetratricopeptide (TPR) repeat protein